MKLDWLDEGSIYLLLPEGLVGAWGGVSTGDYDRACAASDEWLNVLQVGAGTGLVLGGDPGMALVVPEESGEVAVIRWVFADDELELVEFALRGADVSRTEPDLLFDSTEPNWRLFDAAAEPRAAETASRRVVLPVGRVRARTAYLEAGANAAVVHRFTSA